LIIANLVNIKQKIAGNGCKNILQKNLKLDLKNICQQPALLTPQNAAELKAGSAH